MGTRVTAYSKSLAAKSECISYLASALEGAKRGIGPRGEAQRRAAYTLLSPGNSDLQSDADKTYSSIAAATLTRPRRRSCRTALASTPLSPLRKVVALASFPHMPTSTWTRSSLPPLASSVSISSSCYAPPWSSSTAWNRNGIGTLTRRTDWVDYSRYEEMIKKLGFGRVRTRSWPTLPSIPNASFFPSMFGYVVMR
jgi:hypothetical protein